MIGLSRSTYYYRARNRDKKLEQDAELRDRIERIVIKYPGYGYRRVTAQLHRQGLQVNHKRVLRLMRQANLLCRPRRRFVATTESNHGFQIYPNLARRMKTTGLDQLWLADITYSAPSSWKPMEGS